MSPVLEQGMTKSKKQPRCVLIAGPNGAGKTTFARRYLPEDAGVVHFVNADLIASGLSPLKPELAAIAAGRTVLREIDRLATQRVDFAFETTCSGLAYGHRIQAWKQTGYPDRNGVSPSAFHSAGTAACRSPGTAGRPRCATG